MKKYIFDTDIGDDIDDAFALSLLCSLAGKEIAGVTTVFRNTKKRAQRAKTLLAAAGFENVPVYAGESFPYKEPFHLFGKDAENAKPEESAPCQWTEEYAAAKYEDDAVNFIAESAKKYGKDRAGDRKGRSGETYRRDLYDGRIFFKGSGGMEYSVRSGSRADRVFFGDSRVCLRA